MRKIICLALVLGLLLPLVPARAQIMNSPLSGISTLNTTSNVISPSMLSSDIPQGALSDDYLLGMGDKLDVHLIVGDNALVLDYAFVISPEGKIFFPNVGEIALGGLSLKQGRARINQEIKKKYSEKFTLYVMVSTPKVISVYVTGQVDVPGLYPVYDGSRISDLLKTVGVAKGGSDLSELVYLKRRNEAGEFVETKHKLLDVFSQTDGEENILLKTGDILAVPSIKSYVYIYGEVARPGTFGYVTGQTLSDYINVAGGPTPRASLGGVTVTRVENGKPKVYKIDVSEIMQRGVKKNDLEIFAGDVISVPGNFFYFSDFASFANTVLLALTLYSSIAR